MSQQNTTTNKGLALLGKDLLIEGTIHSQKKMILSGTLEGSVFCNQEVVVAEHGQINGTIEGNVVMVAGKVVGDLLAHKRLEVTSTANVRGEVRTPSGQLLIQEGAVMETECITLSEDKPVKQLSST